MKKRNFGFVKFSLIGTECEEFISYALKNGIKIFDIENVDKIIYAKTSPSDYMLLAKIRKSFHVRIHIEEKRGIFFRLYKYRNRYGIVIGALAYGIILLLCSSIVWDISITGNKDISDETILDFLTENGIYAGASRKELKNTMTELKAMLYFDNLAWISIENEGSRVYVKINETISNPTTGLPVDVPCNVVAARGGRIVETEVYRGTMLYEVGSGVAEGDIIVSGIVNDGAGNISVNHADAKIIAEYEEEISFYKEFNTIEKKKTDEKYFNEYIKLFGFTFPTHEETYENGYTYSKNSYDVNIFGIKMPWKRIVIEKTKTEDVEVKRTVNDVKRSLEQELELYEMNMLKNVAIVDRDISFEQDDKGITVKCKYTLQGNIASQQEIVYE